MRQTILRFLFLLVAFCVWAQRPSADKTESGVIERVKVLPISSLDDTLPKVTLEFFLKYEGEGAPIKWEVNDCGEPTRETKADHAHGSAICVQADVGLKDGRAATVLVSVGALSKKPADVPTIYGVRVAYPEGTIHHLDRLSDLPVELHRPLPKGPKDLPAPVSALLNLSHFDRRFVRA
jgi:hypothetical protein